MTVNAQAESLNIRLLKAADDLDISVPLYLDAVNKYKRVKNWLAAKGSPLAMFDPDIYLQGSFRLGTVVKPITDMDDYDIDLVCHLAIEKDQITQKRLKKLVGDRLRQHAEYDRILSEKDRCWRLDFERIFHMDILPAIPDNERRTASWPDRILITDKNLFRWQPSDPKGYAKWFRKQMEVVWEDLRKTIAVSLSERVDDVPDYKIKTPLQRSIQLLKRHRDIHFLNDKDDKPISIIITTLAGHAYDNEADLYEALMSIIAGMPDYIEDREGISWVPNPVNTEENFADKWQKYPQREQKFRAWLSKAQSDYENIATAQSDGEASKRLDKALGKSGNQISSTRSALNRGIVVTHAADVPDLADTSHCQVPSWPVKTRYKVRVNGTVHKRIQESKVLWKLTDRAVPKDKGLRFIANTNTPEPFEVHWQVVNTGQDAKKQNQLRGGFDEGYGYCGTKRWESTAYAGTHWIEAFVVKDGECVARSGRKYVRIRR